jgi:ABC-type lipoprotein export system ATPase subunit
MLERRHMLLELNSVTKSFSSPGGGEPVEILNGVDLQVAKGEAVAIAGPSGSGKSTLLNIIGALDRPTSGKVRFGGRDLADFGESELAEYRNRKIGFVFQLHHLLPQCSVLENVLLPTLAGNPDGGSEAVRARALELLSAVGLEHRLAHRPAQISGGERQRVAVARALINQPALLLADEPTGSLDGVASRQLADLLLALNKTLEVALLLVTHAPDVASRMNRCWYVNAGKLEAASS